MLLSLILSCYDVTVILLLHLYLDIVLQFLDRSDSGILRPVSEIRILFSSLVHLFQYYQCCFKRQCFIKEGNWVPEICYAASKFRSVFSEFPFFNYVQSKALDDVSKPDSVSQQTKLDWHFITFGYYLYLSLTGRFFTLERTLWHVLQLVLVKQCCLSWPLYVC